MIKLHLSDGKTVAVDLSDERQAREWLARIARADFQRSITALTVETRHHAHGRCSSCGTKSTGTFTTTQSIVRPDFDNAYLHVENVAAEGRVKGGERAHVFVDDMRLSVMSHSEQPAARIVLSRVGKQRFNPFSR